MICRSLGLPAIRQLIGSIEPGSFYEIRLDMLKPSELADSGLEEVFRAGARLIATCRPLPAGTATEVNRLSVLQRAIMSGAAYVDIELEAPETYRRALLDTARKYGCRVIVSHHDFTGTPGRPELLEIINRSKNAGGELVKLACQVNVPEDGARLLGLLDGRQDLIVTGMGLLGRIVRIASPLLGSPFTFAAPDQGPLTAPGQIRAGIIEQILRSIEDPSS
jgi:3-dehydroquinate dehydratase I